MSIGIDSLSRPLVETGGTAPPSSLKGLHEPLSTGTSTKGFAITFLSTFLLLSLAALAINVLGNDNGAFPSPIFPSELPAPKKTRELDTLARQDQLPEALIFGSSRVMGIETDQVQSVTGMHTFNYGVFGARPAIYLAQASLCAPLGLAAPIGGPRSRRVFLR